MEHRPAPALALQFRWQLQHGSMAPYSSAEQQHATKTLTHLIATRMLDLTMLLLGAAAALRTFPTLLGSTISGQLLTLSGRVV